MLMPPGTLDFCRGDTVKRRLLLVLLTLLPLWSLPASSALAASDGSSFSAASAAPSSADSGAGIWTGTITVKLDLVDEPDPARRSLYLLRDVFEVTATTQVDGTVAYTGAYHYAADTPAAGDSPCSGQTQTEDGQQSGTVTEPLSVSYSQGSGVWSVWPVGGTDLDYEVATTLKTVYKNATANCPPSQLDRVVSIPTYIAHLPGPADATRLVGSQTHLAECPPPTFSAPGQTCNDRPGGTVTETWDLTLVSVSQACELPTSSSSASSAASQPVPAPRPAPSTAAPLNASDDPYDALSNDELADKIQQTTRALGLSTGNAAKMGLGMTVSMAACASGPAPVKVAGAATLLVFTFGLVKNLWNAADRTRTLQHLLANQAKRAQQVPGEESRPASAPGGVRAAAVPDPNYQVLPQPVPRQMLAQPIVPGNGVTQQLADAVNALAGTLSQLASLEEAKQTALDRAETAYLAHDSVWFARQDDAARAYASQEVPLWKSLQSQFDALQAALTASGVASPITAAQIQQAQQSLASDGFSASIVDAATRLGLSSADLATIKTQVAAVNPNDVVNQSGGSLASTLSASGLVSAFQTNATLDDELARPHPNVGLAPTSGPVHQLTVKVTARDNLCTTNNQLRAIRVTSLTNATLAIPGVGTITAPSASAIPLPGQPSSVAVTVQKLRAGEAATVAVVVTDGCGDWPTFFGGGKDAF
jgi:hypothetical protein